MWMGWKSGLLRGSSPDLPREPGCNGPATQTSWSSWGSIKGRYSTLNMNSTQFYFLFHSSSDMALAGILTEAEIAAGLQSCQGNIYVLNLAFQFICQIPLSPLPQHPNSSGNRKGWKDGLDSIMLIFSPGYMVRCSCYVCLLITAVIVLPKREKGGKMQVLISASQVQAPINTCAL